ncbi:DUF5317 domain-containing protein [Euzebya rosea]|uniref:DUF5317 domain-containing protein n=1 Tax=Euzebya rosea TaxID=2052804 RepID=UPI000D3E4C34|nr:DUF5317 family protein [Euzebya rosea]
MIVLVAAGTVVLAWVLLRRDAGALAGIDLRAPWLPVVVVLAQAVALEVIEAWYAVALGLHALTYAAAVAWLWANRRVRGLWLVGVGALLNVTAMASNGGVMPARSSGLSAAGLGPQGGFVNSAGADSALWFLGDVFAIPDGMPLANVFSVGDVVLITGLALLLWQLPRSDTRSPARPDAPAPRQDVAARG